MVSAVSNTNYRVANSEFRLRATANTFLQKDDFIERYPNIAADLGWATPALWSWGLNLFGQMGDGTILSKSSPVQIGSLTNWKYIASFNGSPAHSAAIKTDGTLWTWGYNPQGQLGIGKGDTISRSSPTQVGTLTNWKIASVGYLNTGAIKTDGTLWLWGWNISGQLGDNTIVDKSSPIQVGSLNDWVYVSVNNHTLAIKNTGTLWTWGNNGWGELGSGTTTPRSSPVQVGSLTNWKYVQSGTSVSLAIKVDGTLWSWGVNIVGQLGQNNVTPRSSPTQVGTLTNWKQISMCGTNNSDAHAASIKTDGTLWTWGYNNKGQLGDGTTIHRSSPVQIGSLTNWKYVTVAHPLSVTTSATKAIKTNGTLWVWGDNTYGQLGQGDIIHRSSPVQVGSLTNWKLVSVSHAIQDGIY